MEFARPEALLLLWLVPLALAFLVVGARRRRHRIAQISGRSGGVRLSASRTITKTILLLTSLALLVIAYAGPRWGFDWQEIQRHGSDIVIAVDVSKSMLAEDINPSRLERAKREVSDLLEVLKGDRVALVAFAGQAFIQCPLTEDYGALRMFLNFLDTELIPVQGTDLGKAIDQSMKALTDGSQSATEGRAIILITDGEDQEGNAEKAAEAATKQGVKIFTVGIGSKEGAPIPEMGGGFKKDQSGNLIVTKPAESILQKIALDSGGMFVRSVTGGMDLARIYREGIRPNVAQNDYKATRQKLWHDRFQWFLAAALLLLVLEFVVIDAIPQSAVLAMAMALAAPTAQATTLRQAHKAYEESDYATATQGFQEEEKSRPDEAENTYNRAVSQFRLGKLEEAVDGFAKASESKDTKLAERSFFNLGNTQAGRGKLDDAIKAYESALAINPKDKEAQENLEFVKKQKEQQKQDQKQQDQDKKDQDNKDQDKKDQNQKGQDQKPDQQKGQDQKPQDSKPDKPEQPQPGEQKDAQKDPQKPDEQQEGQAPKPDEQKPPDQGQKQQPAAAGEQTQPMTQEEAEQLLRAVQDNAQKFMGAPKNGKAPPQQPSKDW